MKWSDSRVRVCEDGLSYTSAQLAYAYTCLEGDGSGLHAQAGELEMFAERNGFRDVKGHSGG